MISFKLTSVLSILLFLTISGCSAPPLIQDKFPEPPRILMERPTEPIAILDSEPITLQSIVQNTVTNNGIHYENRSKLESLQDWLKKQLEIRKAK